MINVREKGIKGKETFITCKYDVAFKEVFLKESNNDLLLAVLGTCLKHSFKKINLINTELLQGNIKYKRKMLDVLIDNSEARINIEVNSNVYSYVRDRNLGYVSNIHNQNVLRGSNYLKFKKTIQINLSYGIKNDDKIYRVYKLYDEDMRCYSDKLIIYEFNMDKIMEFWYSKDIEGIEKYKYLIMMNLDREDLTKLAKNDEKVAKYKMELENANVIYGMSDWISEEEDRKKIEKSLLLEGIERGVQEGIEQNKLQTILNFNALNVPLDIIAKGTDLTEEEVRKIIDENEAIR